MKKYFIFLSLILCCPLFAAEEPMPQVMEAASPSVAAPAREPEGKKLELRMSIPLPNSDFMHLMHNSIVGTIDFSTLNSRGFTRHSASISLEGGAEYPLTLKGMTPIIGGLLAVMVQSINQTQDKIILKRLIQQQSGSSQGLQIMYDGKIQEVNIAEMPTRDLIMTYFVRHESSITEAQYFIPASFEPSNVKYLRTVRVFQEITGNSTAQITRTVHTQP